MSGQRRSTFGKSVKKLTLEKHIGIDDFPEETDGENYLFDPQHHKNALRDLHTLYKELENMEGTEFVDKECITEAIYQMDFLTDVVTNLRERVSELEDWGDQWREYAKDLIPEDVKQEYEHKKFLERI